jgi:hypothetical protein
VVGTTDANGNFTLTGVKTTAGNWTEQWYVGAVAAAPMLSYTVIAAPTGYTEDTTFPSIPNSFTAPAPVLSCANISGTWNEYDGGSPQNGVTWAVQQHSDNSISGLLSFIQIDNPNTPSQCNGGQIDYQVSGHVSGTSFSLSATNPSVSTDACGFPVATSFTDTVSLTGTSCSGGSGNIFATGGSGGGGQTAPEIASGSQMEHRSMSAPISGVQSGGHSAAAVTSSPWPAIWRPFTPQQIHGSTAWTALTPRFNISYAAYIPVDHIPGPTSCVYAPTKQLVNKLYLGDANRGSYRGTQSMFVVPDVHVADNFFRATGETRNYGLGSPAGGNNIQGIRAAGGLWFGIDEDAFAGDCYRWNASDFGPTNDMNGPIVSYPTNTKAQLNVYGTTSNPLEPAFAQIRWNMTITVDDSNPNAPTAQVSYTHSCYPAHIVKVNGTTVYEYWPPRNDTMWLHECLLLNLNPLVGQTQPVPVPGH